MKILLNGMLHHSGGYSELTRNLAVCLNDLGALAALRVIDKDIFKGIPIELFCSKEYLDLQTRLDKEQSEVFSVKPETLFQMAPPFMLQPTPTAFSKNVGFTMFETRVPEDWFKMLGNVDYLALHDAFQHELFHVDLGARNAKRRSWSPWIENPLDSIDSVVNMPPFLLTVGVARMHKNQSKIIQAFNMIRKDFPGLLLVIKAITEDPEYDDYRDLIAGDDDIRVLPGNYSTKAMNNLYAGCAAYVSASMCEGLDMPAIKAAMCGKPVIAGYHTGHKSWIPENHTSLFTTPIDMSNIPRIHPRYREGHMYGYDMPVNHLADHMRAALTPGEQDTYKIDMTGKFTREKCVQSLDNLLKSIA